MRRIMNLPYISVGAPRQEVKELPEASFCILKSSSDIMARFAIATGHTGVVWVNSTTMGPVIIDRDCGDSAD